MSCDLNQYGQYELSNISHDGASGKYIVQIKNPPAKCAEGQFISKNAEFRVDGNLTTGLLKYDSAARRPVILSPSQGFVQELNTGSSSGVGFFGTLLILAAVAGVIYVAYRLFSKTKEDGNEHNRTEPTPPRAETETVRSERRYTAPTATAQTAVPTQQQAAAPIQQTYTPSAQHTTVVVDRGSSDGLLEGVILGSMLNQPREVYHEDRIIERERVVERPAPSTFSSDDDSDDNSSSSNDDSGSTFSSDDSSSSYSSDDSSSSFSSDDSSSSFSSDDSSSSFSSDN